MGGDRSNRMAAAAACGPSEAAGRRIPPGRQPTDPASRGTHGPGEPSGDDHVEVSSPQMRTAYLRTSFSASLGKTNDARKIGKNLFPVHRNATDSPSAASNVS